jgi:hypothetical protein
VSSIAKPIVETTDLDHETVNIEPAQFTRLERMLLFALVSECERCIESEGKDCLPTMNSVDCPFFDFREEYKVYDIELWKELVC